MNPFAPAGTVRLRFILLGYGADGNINTPALVAGQQIYQGYYISDTFQVSSKLTMNYGVRWELPGPWTERFDRLTVLLPDAESPVARPTGLPIRGKLALVNSEDRPSRYSQDRHWKLLHPVWALLTVSPTGPLSVAAMGFSSCPMMLPSARLPTASGQYPGHALGEHARRRRHAGGKAKQSVSGRRS